MGHDRLRPKMILNGPQKGRLHMFVLTRIQFVQFAAAGALAALSVASAPAGADEMIQNLGPVGPHEPLLTTVGSKRVIAFYVPGEGGCDIDAVVWDANHADSRTAARLRVNLRPGHVIHIDSAENRSLTLRCGDFAATLAIIR